MKSFKIYILLLSVLFVACKKDSNDVTKPINPNEEELITTVALIFDSGVKKDTFYFKDIDGAGGLQPTKFDTIRLLSNTTYTLNVVLIDESKSPSDTISNEVLNEAEEHQFFFNSVGGYNITTTALDADINGVPIGLSNEVTTGDSFIEKNNQYKIVLKHQPGIKPTSGYGNSSLGETDIEIDFPILF